MPKPSSKRRRTSADVRADKRARRDVHFEQALVTRGGDPSDVNAPGATYYKGKGSAPSERAFGRPVVDSGESVKTAREREGVQVKGYYKIPGAKRDPRHMVRDTAYRYAQDMRADQTIALTGAEDIAALMALAVDHQDSFAELNDRLGRRALHGDERAYMVGFCEGLIKPLQHSGKVAIGATHRLNHLPLMPYDREAEHVVAEIPTDDIDAYIAEGRAVSARERHAVALYRRGLLAAHTFRTHVGLRHPEGSSVAQMAALYKQSLEGKRMTQADYDKAMSIEIDGERVYVIV